MSSKWTFLSHHAHVLIALSDNPELTMDELAKIGGITTRSVVNVLNDLVEAGYLAKERQGRRTTTQSTSTPRFGTRPALIEKLAT